MSGCARSCALWLLGWTVAGAAFFYFFLTFGRLEPQIYWAAAGAGLFTATCVAYVIGIWNSWRERATLLDTVAGTPPVDGAWVAVSGTIRANSPLRTPLSNLPAVAYEYKISRVERSGKHTSEVTYYDGKALAPSIIATRQGSVRLLAVPLFDVPSEKIEHSTEVANALRYISTTSFQTSNTPKTAKIGVEQELTDDDGNFRVDKKHSDRDVDLEECRYSEKVIQQGEMICAFGIFSQQRGGLIPHSSWAHQARVMRGDATDVARQLRNRIIKYI
ncbi:MAG: hypothetical protein ABI779_01525, partial [Acidobacteriota bacterium]